MLARSTSEAYTCDTLWTAHLRVAATCSDQQPHRLSVACSTPLTTLLKTVSSGLPAWFILRCALHAPAPEQVVLLQLARRDHAAVYPPPQQQLLFEQLMATTPRSSCTHQLAADAGFLCTNPNLPLQLLSMLDTADLLSLSKVSKALHCTTQEQARREEATWWSLKMAQKSHNTINLPDGLTHTSLGTTHGSSGILQSDDSSTSPSSRLDSSCKCSSCNYSTTHIPAYTSKDRQRMHYLSLLLGSPEQAAQLLVGIDTKHRTCSTASQASPQDEYIALVQRFATPGSGRVEVLEVDSDPECKRYIVAAQHMRTFSDSIFGTSRAIERLQDVVDAAASAGMMLCLLHTAA